MSQPGAPGAETARAENGGPWPVEDATSRSSAQLPLIRVIVPSSRTGRSHAKKKSLWWSPRATSRPGHTGPPGSGGHGFAEEPAGAPRCAGYFGSMRAGGASKSAACVIGAGPRTIALGAVDNMRPRRGVYQAGGAVVGRERSSCGNASGASRSPGALMTAVEATYLPDTPPCNIYVEFVDSPRGMDGDDEVYVMDQANRRTRGPMDLAAQYCEEDKDHSLLETLQGRTAFIRERKMRRKLRRSRRLKPFKIPRPPLGALRIVYQRLREQRMHMFARGDRCRAMRRATSAVTAEDAPDAPLLGGGIASDRFSGERFEGQCWVAEELGRAIDVVVRDGVLVAREDPWVLDAELSSSCQTELAPTKQRGRRSWLVQLWRLDRLGRAVYGVFRLVRPAPWEQMKDVILIENPSSADLSYPRCACCPGGHCFSCRRVDAQLSPVWHEMPVLQPEA